MDSNNHKDRNNKGKVSNALKHMHGARLHQVQES